jgi:hypothetical protein
MLFEALTASVLGWAGGVALVILLPLALASLALLAPVALEEGRLPAGFNPDQWRSLGLLATSQHAPWSLALMGAQRLAMLFGGATAVFLTGVLYYVGYAGRLDLHRQLSAARDGGQRQEQAVQDLRGQVQSLTAALDAARAEADRQRQRAAECEQRGQAAIVASSVEREGLNSRFENERRRREEAQAEVMRLNGVVVSFNSHLRDLNRQITEQCPMVTPVPRPGSLPDDPDAPRPPGPPFGQRPPPRPPLR